MELDGFRLELRELDDSRLRWRELDGYRLRRRQRGVARLGLCLQALLLECVRD